MPTPPPPILIPASPPSPSTSTLNSTNKFYTTSSEKPFAKSAAKRQSVQALGSIQRLQHQFVKFGLANSKERSAGIRGGTRGGSATRIGAEMIDELGEGKEDGELAVPPTPVAREMDVRMPWEREVGNRSIVKGEKQLRREMSVAPDLVSQKWGLSSFQHSRFESEISQTSESSQSDDGQPLLSDLINTTTEAIRRVQRYCVALPADKFTSISTPSSSDSPDRSPASHTSDFVKAASIMEGESASTQTTATSKSPRSSSSSSGLLSTFATLSSSNTASTPESNPLLSLRKSTIDVLTMLKSLETRYRIYTSSPVSSTPTPQATNSSQLSTLDEDDSNPEEEAESIEELAYRTDVALEDLSDEMEIIRQYVELIEKVSFPTHSTKRKSKKSSLLVQSISTVPEESPQSTTVSQRSSSEGEMKKKGSPLGHRRSAKIDPIELEEFVAGEEIMVALGLGAGGRSGAVDEDEDGEGEEEEDLPDWASDDEMDLLHRAHAIFLDHLPSNLVSRIANPSNRSQFLESLSDGTLLCKSYNAVLRSSNRPFGFIPPNSIHDLDPVSSVLRAVVPMSGDSTGMEKKERIGTTFRRSENLRIWVGALKFRYQISLSSKLSKSSMGFDEKVIATKGEHWEEMLEIALRGWVEAVLLECRGGRDEE